MEKYVLGWWSFVFFVLFLFSLWGCHKVADDLIPDNRVMVNPELAVEALLYEACDSVFWIPLQIPDSMIWADIVHAKCYGEYIILADVQFLKTFSIFDIKGGFIGQLNKRGKGPGEYIYPYAFTYLSATNELVVNDRMKGYYFYTLPDLQYSRQIHENTFLKNS